MEETRNIHTDMEETKKDTQTLKKPKYHTDMEETKNKQKDMEEYRNKHRDMEKTSRLPTLYQLVSLSRQSLEIASWPTSKDVLSR